MCGIAGYLGRRPPGEDRARRCLERMRHRGPDSSGSYRHQFADGRHVLLLHSRLSIIDLDPRAGQPFRRGNRVIAYNGEIYNFVELRRQLEREGEVFASTSDTEVLLAGLTRHGAGFIDRLEGMWAWAAYDEAGGVLELCRDRFGEKPLFVMETPDGLYFGSEIKFLAALAGGWPAVNRNHLRRYLVNGYKALFKGSETYFEGVRELPAGHRLVLAPGARPREERHWTPDFATRREMSFAEAAAGVRERLIESVRLRLRSDVPIAFCMSGGIDSNALICTAKRVLGYDVRPFTIVNTDARYEESEQVDIVARELGLDPVRVPLRRSGFVDDLRRLVWQHDGPVATISYFVHWQLMQRVAAAGFKVSVSGTAADELFSGYYDHHNLYLAAMAGDPARAAEALADWRAKVAPIVRNPFLQDPELFVKDPGFRGHITIGNDRFEQALVEPWHEDWHEERYCADLLRNRMANELLHESVPVILREDDLNAMSVSVENRSPFLDRALFDFAYAIPTRHLVQGGLAKAVLREAMRGIVPDPVLDNPRKVGFNAPLLELLDAKDPEVVDTVLADGPIYEIVRKDAVRDVLNKDFLLNSESKFLFNCLCAKFFLDMESGLLPDG